MRCTLVATVLLTWTIGMGQALADRTFYLSFDRLERTPVRVAPQADESNSPEAILLSDSAKLVTGVNGFGIYLDDRADHLCLPSGSLHAEAGSVSFWFRPMWESNDERGKTFFWAAFEKGHIQLFSNALCPMTTDAADKQHYSVTGASADILQWKAGQWHHAALVWSVQQQTFRLFIDGAGRANSPYYPPSGSARMICLSPPPTEQSGRMPACAVFDEVALYDHALSEEEIAALHRQGLQLLAGQIPGNSLNVSVYPNLAAGARLIMTPKPNYGPPTYRSMCNGPDDAKQLSDGEKETAHFSDSRSVGWMDSPKVVLDYDLGVLQRIDTVGVNIGAGQSGPLFPKKVRFFLGSTPDQCELVGEMLTEEPVPNPEYPKWHAKLVGLKNLDRYARFVRIEFETTDGGLFLDEVMVVAKGAQPLFQSLDVASARKASTEVDALASAAANQPAANAAPSDWSMELATPTPDLLHRGDTLRLKIVPRATPPAAIDVTYTAQMLERGNTIYTGGERSGWKKTEVNSRMKTVLEGRKSLPVASEPKEALLELPLKDHPYGLFYLSVAACDQVGKPLKEETFRYQVLMDLPEKRPGNLAGVDGYGGAYAWYSLDDPHNKPDAFHQRMLRDYGFEWAHFRNSWQSPHTGPGKIAAERLLILDRWVESARQQGAKIVFTLVDGIPEVIGDDTKLFEQMYREWAELFISRYGEKVAVWEVWNEPDSKPYAMQDDRDMFAIRTVHELRNKYCPGSAVITSTHSSGGLNYLERILQKGAGPCLNGIAVHPYRTLAPDALEPDAYSGNPTGLATLLTSLEDARELLEKYQVTPPDVYVTEVNYALNLQPQYDENDQANFMARMNLLAWTTGYTKCFIHHALHNGRLAAVTYPNLVRHMVDTTFDRRLDVGDDEVHAYLFQKSDGQVIVPIWSIKADRLVRVSGLANCPEVTDIYGNPVRFEYDAAAAAADFLEISQAPIYLAAAAGSRPRLSASHRLQLVLPERVEPGETTEIRVVARSLVGVPTKLVLQTPVDWNASSQSQEITESRTCSFPMAIGPDVELGVYPVVASLLEGDDRLLSMVGAELHVGCSPVASEKTSKVFADDFQRGVLTDWQVQEGSQNKVDVVSDGDTRVLRMVQEGVDHAASVFRPTAVFQRGSLEFRWKASALGQTVTARLGDLALQFDGQGGFGVLADGRFQLAGHYVAGSWHRLRAVFSAPEGQVQLWLDDQPLGVVRVPPQPTGYSGLRFLSGTQPTSEPVQFLLDDVRLACVDEAEASLDKPSK